MADQLLQDWLDANWGAMPPLFVSVGQLAEELFTRFFTHKEVYDVPFDQWPINDDLCRPYVIDDWASWYIKEQCNNDKDKYLLEIQTMALPPPAFIQAVLGTAFRFCVRRVREELRTQEKLLKILIFQQWPHDKLPKGVYQKCLQALIEGPAIAFGKYENDHDDLNALGSASNKDAELKLVALAKCVLIPVNIAFKSLKEGFEPTL